MILLNGFELTQHPFAPKPAAPNINKSSQQQQQQQQQPQAVVQQQSPQQSQQQQQVLIVICCRLSCYSHSFWTSDATTA